MNSIETFTTATSVSMFAGIIMMVTNHNPVIGASITIISTISLIVGIMTGYVKSVDED